METKMNQEVTDEQIAALQQEAAEAGDLEMVQIARRALAGSAAARTECERVIVDARAMQEGICGGAS